METVLALGSALEYLGWLQRQKVALDEAARPLNVDQNVTEHDVERAAVELRLTFQRHKGRILPVASAIGAVADRVAAQPLSDRWLFPDASADDLKVWGLLMREKGGVILRLIRWAGDNVVNLAAVGFDEAAWHQCSCMHFLCGLLIAHLESETQAMLGRVPAQG